MMRTPNPREVHKQVVVKVNAFADETIAPLVEALNRFERIETIDSCQGYGGRPAYVYFRFRGSPREFLVFLQRLSVNLGTRLDSCCDYSVRAEWLAGAKEPRGQLWVRSDYVPILAEALLGVHQGVALNAEHLTVA